MNLNTTDNFTRYLILKARSQNHSTVEILNVFKLYYGVDYANALANFLMDALTVAKGQVRWTDADRQFAETIEREAAEPRWKTR